MEKSEEYLKRYNAIVNYLDKNHDKIENEKREQDFERYDYIVKYFNENKDRVNVNLPYLFRLNKEFFNKVFSRNSSDKISMEFNDLRRKLHPILYGSEPKEKKENIVNQWIGELI